MLIYWHYQSQVKHIENTQNKLRDKELLLKFNEEPDGFLTPERLMATTSLTKKEAKFRLSYLGHLGLIKTSYNNSFKSISCLSAKLDLREVPELSNKPFLTVEDILKLFKTYDYSIGTGLPISIIQKEMKYFEKEKVIETFTEYSADGVSSKKFWVLKEPYRSNPDQFLALESKMNLELEQIYIEEERKEDYI